MHGGREELCTKEQQHFWNPSSSYCARCSAIWGQKRAQFVRLSKTQNLINTQVEQKLSNCVC